MIIFNLNQFKETLSNNKIINQKMESDDDFDLEYSENDKKELIMENSPKKRFIRVLI